MSLDAKSLHGFVPAVVTPFTPEGEIMSDAYAQMVETMIGYGATAICVAGDNGESWTLDADERKALTRIAVKTSAGRVPVMTGASAPSSKQSIVYARAALEGGADGLLMMPQTYVLKATREELLRRFETVAKNVDAPIVLYNSLRRTGIDLSVDDIGALLSVAPVIGIKESSRDFFHLTRLLRAYSEKMSVMVGPCTFIMPGIAQGAAGFIATGPELFGPLAGQMTEMATRVPQAGERDLHYRLSAIYATLMSVGTWPSAIKAAFNLQGIEAGVPRDPVQPLAGADLDRLRGVMEDLDLLGGAK